MSSTRKKVKFRADFITLGHLTVCELRVKTLFTQLEGDA